MLGGGTTACYHAIMNDAKPMTLRLPESLAEVLTTVAATDRMSVTEAVRIAVERYVEQRMNDPAFRRQLKDRLARAARMLDGSA